MIPRPYLYAALALCVAALLAGVYALGRHHADEACTRRIDRMVADAAARRDALQADLTAMASRYEEAKRLREEQREVRTNTIREVYRNVEVPAVCVPDPAAVRMLDAALADARAAAPGQPRAAVPKADPPT